MRGKGVILLSGGLDSATVAAMAINQGFVLSAITFNYSQRHEIEIMSAGKLAEYFKIKNHMKAVKITFTSGYLKDFPNDLKQWLKVKVSTLFEFREEIVSGTIISKTKHVDSILQRYRIRN